ncbi:MAG: hypothetical protein JF610_17610 [Acidobacteria bacterium]|nr:hypothetical protein [Acidobacteriota bacterium]
MTVPLRIGFDMDGVVADMDAELLRQAEIVFGRPMAQQPQRAADPVSATPPETSSPEQAAAEAAPDNVPPQLRLNLTSRQQRRLWHHVEAIENFWQTLDETEPGKSAGATAQLQSQRWLESKGFTLPSVFVVQGSRGRIAAALGLDLVIDDRPENCLDVVVDSKARAILIWRDDANQLPAAARRLGIGVVKTLSECLDILTQVDDKDRESPRVIDRVKRLLGFKEPANV